jgi:Fumble
MRSRKVGPYLTTINRIFISALMRAPRPGFSLKKGLCAEQSVPECLRHPKKARRLKPSSPSNVDRRGHDVGAHLLVYPGATSGRPPPLLAAAAENKDLEDYDPADVAMALCRMVSYNIGQLAYLNAKRYGLARIFFGGFFIRGHPYTMETISFAIRFWSKVAGSLPCV